MTVPLSNITVIDLSRILAGPYCTMMLGDMGAEVIKVESPGGDDSRQWGPPFDHGESAYFLSVNRNKKGICLNLKRDEGKRILERLLAGADVLIENFRPGTMARLGFDPETLTVKFPRLVCCSISGYGQTGPLRNQGGFDAIMQAEGGWMDLTGMPDGPPTKMGASLADIFTGMMALQGVLSALYEREKTGRGRRIDVSLFDSVVSTLCYHAQGYFMTGEVPTRLGNRHPSLTPYETFETADGYVTVGVGNDALWKRFRELVHYPPIDEARYDNNSGRVRDYAELRGALEILFRGKTTEQWVHELERAGIPVGQVRDVKAVFDNPQIAARGMRRSVHHPSIGTLDLVGNPVRVSGWDMPLSPPPRLGEHNALVLSERLGLSSEEIAGLKASGVLGGESSD